MDRLEREKRINTLQNRSDYKRNLYAFINQTVDLHEIAQNYLGYVVDTGKHGKNTAKINFGKPVNYKNPATGNHIVISPMKNGKPGYMWSPAGTKLPWEDKQRAGVTGLIVFSKNYPFSDDGKNRALQDVVNDILSTRHQGALLTFQDQAIRELYKESRQQFIKVAIDPTTLSAGSAEVNDPIESSDTEAPTSPSSSEATAPLERAFDFNPVQTHHPIFADRGITAATLEAPPFKKVFGESNHPRLGGGDYTTGLFFPKDLQYESHLLIPYRNAAGDVTAIEYRNRLTDEKYAQYYTAYLEGGESVRRNPSKFELHSAKENAIWHSNLAINPKQLVIGEQALDVLSYYQLQQDKQDFSNTTFFATGGTLTHGQLRYLRNYIKDHSIPTIQCCFDMDIHGLSYSLALAQQTFIRTLDPTKSIPVPNWIIHKGTNSISYRLDIKDIRRESIQKFQNESFQYFKLIKSQFPFENTELTPNFLRESDTILSMEIPFTKANAQLLFQLHKQILGIPVDQYQLQWPDQSKDWNDALMGHHNYSEDKYQLLVDHVSNRNRVFIGPDDSIIYQRRMSSFETSPREFVGSYRPFQREKPAFILATLPTYDGKDPITADFNSIRQAIETQFSQLEDGYRKQVGRPVDYRWLQGVLTRDIVFSPLMKSYMRQQEPLAQLDATGALILPEHVVQADRWAIQAMSYAHEKGEEYDVNGFRFYQNFRGYQLYEKTFPNNGIFYQDGVVYQTITHGEYRSQGGKYSFESYGNQDLPASVLERRDQYIQSVLEGKPIAADLAAQYTENDKHQLIERFPIGKWNAQERVLELNEEANLEDDVTERIVERMQRYLREGREPNMPGWIGTLTSKFVLEWAPGFVPERDLDQVRLLQFYLIDQALYRKQVALAELKSRYHEPFYSVTSENGIFKYNGVPFYRYDSQQRALLLLIDKAALANRSFHPYFYKSLTLFLRNKGVFFKYINQLKVQRTEQGHYSVFYKDPRFICGYIFKDTAKAGNGNYYVALLPDLPHPLKDEIRSFIDIPEASSEIIQANTINLVRESNAHIKEAKNKAIPFEYTPFYDRNGKFIPVSEEVLAGYSPNQYLSYMAAYMWNLENQIPVQTTKLNPYSITLKGTDLYYGPIQFAKYDAETDRLVFLIAEEPNAALCAEIALLEKQLVKHSENQQFAKYLKVTAPAEIPTPRAVSKERFLDLLSKMALNTDTGEVLISDKNFTVQRLGILQDGVLKVDIRFKEFAPLRETLEFYARHKQSKVEWISLSEPVQTPMQEVPIEFNNSKKFPLNLLLSNKVILSSLPQLDIFRNSLTLDESGIQFVSMGKGNKSFTHPFGTDWKNLPEPVAWMSKYQREDYKRFIICETPEQALLHFQGVFASSEKGGLPGILKNMNDRLLYLSMPNRKLEDIELVAKSFIRPDVQVELVGVSLQPLVKGLNAIKLTHSIDYEADELKIVDRLKKQFHTYKPSSVLQTVFNNFSGHNVLNPAEGLAFFPITTESLKGVSILGDTLTGKIPDQLWFSRDPKDPAVKGIVLAPTIEEAVYFLGYERQYCQQECVIAFNDTVSENQAKRLSNLLNNPRFLNRIRIINSDRLFEKLAHVRFALAGVDAIINPDPDLSFKEKVTQLIQHEWNTIGDRLPVNETKQLLRHEPKQRMV